MRLLRRVVFYLFFIAYLIVCPLTILRALGYAFRPGDEQALIQTSLISLATSPPNASVFIGNRRYTSRTPAILRRLKPGAYPIRVTLKGYRPWAETVSVEAEKATVLEKIILIPQTLRSVPLLRDPIERLIPLPGTSCLLLLHGPTLGTARVYDLQAERVWPLIPPGSALQEAVLRSFATVDGSRAVLAHVELEGVNRTLWIALHPDGNRVELLTALLPAKPQQVTWDPRNPRELFLLSNGAVRRIDVPTRAVSANLAESVIGLGVEEDTLYLLTSSGLTRGRADSRQPASLLGGSELIRTLFGRDSHFRILPFDREALVFWGSRGELLAGRLPYRFIERGVRGLAWTPRRLLAWEKDRIGIVDFNRELPADELVQPVPEFRWLVKGGREIEQAFWAYDGSHVLFRDGDRILLSAADPSDASPPQELLQVKPGSAIAYDDATASLAYLDRSTGRLARLTLFQRPRLFSLERAAP